MKPIFRRQLSNAIKAFCLLLAFPAHADTLTGHPRITDGDTITIGKTKIRILGIDAPEIHQLCGYPIAWPCGIASKQALEAKIGNQPVNCIGNTRDRYKRLLAHCYLGMTDLGRWLIQQGLAVDFTKYSSEYIPDQNQAQKAKIGIWSGDFTMPWDWRRAK